MCGPSCEKHTIYPFQQALGTITLSAEKRTIIEERYIHLLRASHARCNRVAILFHTNRSVVTIGSIIVPALLSIQYTNSTPFSAFSASIYWTTWIISLLVTISNGLLTMFKLDKKYYMIHASYEQLKTEGWQFLALTGNYKKQHTHEEEFYRFCQIVERIRIRQMEEEYIKLQDVGPPAVTPKPLAAGSASDIPVLFDYPRTPAKDDVLFTIARVLKQHMDAAAPVAPSGNAIDTPKNVIVDINRATDENTEPTSNQGDNAAQKTGFGISRNGRRESVSVFN